MSLRRSARNAKSAELHVDGALYEKVGTNGSPTKPPSPLHGSGDHSASSLEPQKKHDARKNGTATSSVKTINITTASQTAATLKKPAASRKRKASVPGQEPSMGTVPDVSNPSEILASANALSELNGVDSLPATPVPKQRRRGKEADTVSPVKPVPFTPTPSGVGLIAGNANVRKTKDTDHMLDDLAALNRNRPAAPDVTNAPVLTPNGSQVVVNNSPSKKRKTNDLPPDVGSPMKSTSTIDALLKDAEAYLIKVDKEVTGNGRLERLIAGYQCKMFNPEGLREVVDPFTALASGIIGQQVRRDCWRHNEH